MISKTRNSDEEMWQCGFSPEEIDNLDLEKLEFALKESRVYLENVSEKINRLSNKGFILIGFVGGITGFVVSRSLDFIFNPARDVVSTIHQFWPAVLVVLFCLTCLLDAFCTLLRSVLSPISVRPLGAHPKNLLHKGVFDFSLRWIIVRQMECYQKVADDNVAQIKQIALCIRRCLRLAFVYPMVAILVWFLLTYCLYPLLLSAHWA